MNNTNKPEAPKCDPTQGMWTPKYVEWAISNLTDKELEEIYKLPRATVLNRAGLKSDSKPKQPKPAESKEVESAPLPQDEVSQELGDSQEETDQPKKPAKRGPKKGPKKAAKKTAKRKEDA